MMPQSDSIQERAELFARQNDCELISPIFGWGMDGTVFRTNRQSALKILKWQSLYARERDAYLRLKEHGIDRICECNVPTLLSFDDDLWAVEMTIVSPPYIIDFAGAFVDEKPEYPPEVLEAWLVEKREQFEGNWAQVRRIVYAFEQLGIYLSDVNPNNIRLLAKHDEQ